jgi:hypothetical protein
LITDVAIKFGSSFDWLSNSGKQPVADSALCFEYLAVKLVEANCQGQTQEQTGARHSSPRQSDDEQHLTPNSCVKIYQYCRSDFDRFGYDR